MSGIAGICHVDGRPAERASLERMTAPIAHRGPDGIGYWTAGAVGFAHLALHTTPESAGGQQPLFRADERLCVTLDGRIDNREELRTAFRGSGIALRDDTDADLVLRAYERWREDCPRHLIGDYAFAIWDAAEQTLFCARDLIGLRPFYYRFDGRVLAFASEIPPLLETPGCRRELNLGMLAEYLCDAHVSVDETLYREILRLPPGHRLRFKAGVLRVERCVEVDPALTIRCGSDEEYAERFLELFREAVRCRLRTQAPAAIFLSGGLDSSAILAMSASLNRDSAVAAGHHAAYHLQINRREANEREFVDELAAMWPGRYLIVDGAAALAARTAGDPPRDTLPAEEVIPPWEKLHAAARADGCRVVLWGYGADETLTGNPAHCADLLRRLQLGRLIRRVRHDIAVHRHWETSIGWRAIARWCLEPLFPMGARAALRRVLRREVPRWFTPEFARAIDFPDRLGRRMDVPAFRTLAQREIYASLFGGYRISTTEICGRQDARFGMEGRSPFFDRRLVEFTLALPEDQRWRDAQTKFVLRTAMQDLLPYSLRQRPTKGTYTQLFREMIDRQWAGAEVGSMQLVMEGYVDGEKLSELYGRYSHGDESAISSLGSVLSVERWLKNVRAAEGHPARHGDSQMSADRTKSDPENARRTGLPAAGQIAKKPYLSPKLTKYGSILELTSTTTSGSKNDGGGGSMNMMV
jgi:asparagine synthase (glutamine-hydrolysing)